jgi:hypothetical protein
MDLIALETRYPALDADTSPGYFESHLKRALLGSSRRDFERPDFARAILRRSRDRASAGQASGAEIGIGRAFEY